MGAIDGIPLLLTAAEVIARRTEEKISEINSLMELHGGTTDFVNGLRMATLEIELAAVGILSIFEARMKNHLPQGPFFKRLRERLTSEGRDDLEVRVHRYYLAVNVLKHGRGASYDELRRLPKLDFGLKGPEDAFFNEGDVSEPEGLVDLRDGFFSGLVDTLRDVYIILEHDTWAWRTQSSDIQQE